MGVTIEQSILYGNADNGAAPVGQNLVFTVNNDALYLSLYFNVKYLAELHVSNTPIDLSTTESLVATFKTTPNNQGAGIFDFRSLLESYVASDNTGWTDTVDSSSYKGVAYSPYSAPHSIHTIDQYARGIESVKYFAIQFKAEGALSATGTVQIISTNNGFIDNSAVNSLQYTYFNGVLQRENYLTLDSNSGYGYDLASKGLYTGDNTNAGTHKFLSNAPTTQYANVNDYGTFAFLNFLPQGTDQITKIDIKYYAEKNAAGAQQGSTYTIDNTNANGGVTSVDSNTSTKLQYVGVFPGNLQNTATGFLTTYESYTVQAFNGSTAQSQLYIINVNCPDTKGYESIRLCWLNQWGVWDYYTFIMKSVRSTSTNRTTYTQMSGSWNGSRFAINGYKGGRKNFRVNATERITVNTDFVNEAEAIWFEELLNSQEVYMLNGYDGTETAPYDTITNKYVEPVLITTSSYTRKTIANDKLMQYTFELERNKTQQTHTA